MRLNGIQAKILWRINSDLGKNYRNPVVIRRVPLSRKGHRLRVNKIIKSSHATKISHDTERETKLFF